MTTVELTAKLATVDTLPVVAISDGWHMDVTELKLIRQQWNEQLEQWEEATVNEFNASPDRKFRTAVLLKS